MSRPPTIAATYERTVVRLPPYLIETLHQLAEARGCPVNTLVIEVLTRGLVTLPAPSPRRVRPVRRKETG